MDIHNKKFNLIVAILAAIIAAVYLVLRNRD